MADTSEKKESQNQQDVQLSSETKNMADVSEKKEQAPVPEITNNIVANITENLTDIYESNDLPLLLGVRFSLKGLINVDTSNQTFGVKGVMYLSWKATNIDTRNYVTNKQSVYKPQFVPNPSFINDVETISYQTEPIIIKKGYNMQTISINVRFTQQFSVNNFPFDVQDLCVVFEQNIGYKEIRHVPSPLYSKYLKLDRTWLSLVDWNVVNIGCSVAGVKLVSYENSAKYEIVTVRFQIQRKWKGIALRIILWLTSLGIMSCSTFSIPVSSIGDRLSYAITMTLTVVAFQFIITSELPRVNFMTLLDKFNLFIFLFILAITVETAIIGNEIFFDLDDAKEIDHICAIIFGSIFVMGIILFFIYSMIVNRKENNKIGIWNPYKPDVLRVTNEQGMHQNDVIQE